MYNKYHKKFLNSFSSENVIALFSRYRNSYKEITESWGMLEAAKLFYKNINNSIVLEKVIIVGDGCSPRTAAIFAYYTKAEVISIDPNFNMKHWWEHYTKQVMMGFPPKRLLLLNKKLEDIDPIDCVNKQCIIIWPHSHADMNKSMNKIVNFSNRIDINMPCCVKIPDNWQKIPHITYTDENVLSPKNIIHVWQRNSKDFYISS